MADETHRNEGGLLTDEVAEINLLAEQGEFARAMELCRRLISEHPATASLHEAMGDLHRRRGDWVRATASYEEALQLTYDADVLSKLGEVRGRSAEARRQQVPTALPQEEIPGAVRSPQKIRLLLGVAAVAVFVALVLIITSLHAPSPGSGGRDKTAARGGAGWKGGPAAGTDAAGKSLPASTIPAHSESRQAGQAATSAKATASAVSATRSPAPRPTSGGINVTQEVRGPLTDRDRNILQAVQSLTWPGGESLNGHVSVMFDPFTSYAMITIEAPDAEKLPRQYEAIIQQSYAVAVAALRQETGLQFMTVRCLASVRSGDRTLTDVAFRGNTTRETIELWQHKQATPTLDDLWQRVFATPWWNPQATAG